MASLLLIAALSYLAGSFPTSVVTGKLGAGIDLRQHGSGSAGMTNALRVLGWKHALLAGVVDVGKGVLAVLLISRVRVDPLPVEDVWAQALAGAAAVVGHVWPLLAGFRGGKGVATAAGVFLALQPLAAGVCLAVFVAVAFLSRTASLGSMAAAVSLPVTLIALRSVFAQPVSGAVMAAGLVTAPFLLFTHRSNIARLLKGTESSFGSRP